MFPCQRSSRRIFRKLGHSKNHDLCFLGNANGRHRTGVEFEIVALDSVAEDDTVFRDVQNGDLRDVLKPICLVPGRWL